MAGSARLELLPPSTVRPTPSIVMKTSFALALGAAVLHSPLLHAQGSVWVVDDNGGPGVDFTDLAPAMAGSAAGDVLLVKAGNYGPFTLDGPRTVVAEAGELVRVEGAVTGAIVGPLAAGEVAVVRGVHFRSPGRPLDVVPGDGLAWFEDCSFVNTHAGSLTSMPMPGAIVDGASVAFLRSTLRGGEPTPLSTVAGLGLLAVAGAEVHLYDCEVLGGDGEAYSIGGAGLRLVEAFAFASGCLFAGGHGGDPDGACCGLGGGGFGGDGGDGASLVGPNALPSDRDSSFVPGIAGAGGACFACSPGHPGVTVAIEGGAAFEDLPGLARSFSASAPVREGGAVAVSVQGVPGDLVLVGISPAAAALQLPALFGTLLVSAPPQLVVPLGVLPASGALALSFPVGQIASESLALASQAVFVTPAGPAFLGCASEVVILDASF